MGEVFYTFLVVITLTSNYFREYIPCKCLNPCPLPFLGFQVPSFYAPILGRIGDIIYKDYILLFSVKC